MMGRIGMMEKDHRMSRLFGRRMKNTNLVILILAALVGPLFYSDYGPVKPGIARADEDTKLGKQVYRQSCIACHGERGDGKGPKNGIQDRGLVIDRSQAARFVREVRHICCAPAARIRV